MLTLRAVCAREEANPRLWALYGAQCARLGKRDEARAAFERALWLRGRARQHGRVRVLQKLIERSGEKQRWVA